MSKYVITRSTVIGGLTQFFTGREKWTYRLKEAKTYELYHEPLWIVKNWLPEEIGIKIVGWFEAQIMDAQNEFLCNNAKS